MKRRIVTSIIWSVALYAAETWAYFKKEYILRLKAFEMWECWCGGRWNDQLERLENKWRGATNGTGRKKSHGCDLEKEVGLDRSYTQRWKLANGGDKTKGENDWVYAKWVSERSVVCGIKEKGITQERMENMEAKNLPKWRNTNGDDDEI